MNEQKMNNENSSSLHKIEDLLADAFPHLEPEQIRLIAHLLEQNKGKYDHDFKTALKAILGQEDADDFAKFMDYLSTSQEVAIKKVGRPLSKVTSEKYFQEQLNRIARTYVRLMFAAIEASRYDLSERGKEFWVPKSFRSESDLPYETFVSYELGSSTSENLTSIDKTDFNFGAWWSMVLIMNIVYPAVLDRIPELWSIGKHVDKQMKMNIAKGSFLEKIAGFSRDMVELFVSFKNSMLPIEHVKKLRKAKRSQKQVARFTRNVKEVSEATPELIAENMDISVEEVMYLYEESRRQKKDIILENTEKGQIFRVKLISRE